MDVEGLVFLSNALEALGKPGVCEELSLNDR